MTGQQAAGLIEHLVLLHMLHSKYCSPNDCLQLLVVQEAGIRLRLRVRRRARRGTTRGLKRASGALENPHVSCAVDLLGLRP